MGTNLVLHEPAVSDRLHPTVYAAIVGLALWFTVSAWEFAGVGNTDMLLVVVSGFIFIVAVAIPYALWRVWRRSRDSNAQKHGAFRDWASCEFDTGQCRLKGATAMVEILLPIAAVAFGMTAFAIVFYFAAHGTP